MPEIGRKCGYIMIVKLYDAENGVEKIIKNAVSLAMYNGKIVVTDNKNVEFFIPPHEFEKHCVYATDDVEERNND